jgi:hypothetical protein
MHDALCEMASRADTPSLTRQLCVSKCPGQASLGAAVERGGCYKGQVECGRAFYKLVVLPPNM